MASKKIGALWQKQTKDGKRYLSGILEDLSGDIRIAIFPNDRKQKDTEPDFTILRSDQSKEQKPTSQPGDFLSGDAKASFDTQAPATIEPGNPDHIDVDKIPF